MAKRPPLVLSWITFYPQSVVSKLLIGQNILKQLPPIYFSLKCYTHTTVLTYSVNGKAYKTCKEEVMKIIILKKFFNDRLLLLEMENNVIK